MGTSTKELFSRERLVNGTGASNLAGSSAFTKVAADPSRSGISRTLFSVAWARWRPAFLGLLIPTILVAAWEILVRLGQIDGIWESYVFTAEGIDRRFYELCVMAELKNALRSGDVSVSGSRQFRGFEEYLMPHAEFNEGLADGSLRL